MPLSATLIMSRIAVVVLALLLSACSTRPETIVPPQHHDAAIASAHPLATEAGLRILQHGGNAFDAAVAVTAALAVVEPYSSGLGGGGFWLLHNARDDTQVMIDGRETAPLAAHRDMYLDADGEVLPRASIDGPLAAGIPGVPAALEHLAKRYGRLPLRDSLQPAITLAREGFVVDEHYRRMAQFRLAALQDNAAADIFLLDGEVPPAGHRITQPDLARTLERIAAQGAAGFYHGELAQRMVDAVRANGGIWSLQDLAQYRVIERLPLQFSYGGMRVTSVVPPSSGGVALAQMFNMLALGGFAQGDAVQQKHLLIEAMRRAYRDRAEFLGDSDFVEVPVIELVSAAHARELLTNLDRWRATASASLPTVAVDKYGGADTTHFSIVDHEGNRVAATLSINYPFGSGFVAGDSGVLLNDEMDDFSSKPGTPNVYGLVGAEANAIAPGKRMLSSMSPTFAEYGDRIAVLGTPGGSRIITMVLLGLLEFYRGTDAQGIVNAPRFHHQYLPDKVFYEPGALPADLLDALQAMGHDLQRLDSDYGNMQVVILDRRGGRAQAASDRRGVGAARVLRQP